MLNRLDCESICEAPGSRKWKGLIRIPLLSQGKTFEKLIPVPSLFASILWADKSGERNDWSSSVVIGWGSSVVIGWSYCDLTFHSLSWISLLWVCRYGYIFRPNLVELNHLSCQINQSDIIHEGVWRNQEDGTQQVKSGMQNTLQSNYQ